MRERLRSLFRNLVRMLRIGHAWQVLVAAFAIGGLLVLGALYLAGAITYDFTLAPEERAVDAPGPPYLDGRHYAIYGFGENGDSRRVYTVELVGDGDSGAIRVWEDTTGQGTFVISDGKVRVEMQRMVPPEQHQFLEPNVFEGTMSADGAVFEGTWTAADWIGGSGDSGLTGEYRSCPFRAERL